MWVSERTNAARCQRVAATLAGNPIFWLVFIAAMFTWPILRSIHAGRALPRNRPALGSIHDFELRDQNGGKFGAAELRGRLWVASFTSVECQPSCAQSQRALAQMEMLRHRTRNLGDAIRLVTFTLDPERDTPERMLDLSATHRAIHGTWRFVSGPASRVRDVLRNFEIAEGALQTHLALVDGEMQIRSYYEATDDAAIALLLRDVSVLLSPPSE